MRTLILSICLIGLTLGCGKSSSDPAPGTPDPVKPNAAPKTPA